MVVMDDPAGVPLILKQTTTSTTMARTKNTTKGKGGKSPRKSLLSTAKVKSRESLQSRRARATKEKRAKKTIAITTRGFYTFVQLYFVLLCLVFIIIIDILK